MRSARRRTPPWAPAREADLSGLPRTYIEVGDLDIVKGENLEYAVRLADAGVSRGPPAVRCAARFRPARPVFGGGSEGDG
jgi:acetyl esterase/lipase